MIDQLSMEHQNPHAHEFSAEPTSINATSVHDKLAKYMETAQKHPPGSTPRNIAVTTMIRAMQQSRKISLWMKDQPFYDDALSHSWVLFVQKLDVYNREKGNVLTWFNNYILNNQLRNLYEKAKSDHDHTIQLHSANDDQSHNPIEQIPDPTNISTMPKQSILEPFNHWLQEMSELDDIHISNRPDISVRRLLHYRILKHSDYPNWHALGEYFNENVKRLQNGWDRKCKPEMENFWAFHQWFQPIAELSVSDNSNNFDSPEHSDGLQYHQKIIELRVTRMDKHRGINAYRVLYHRYQYALEQGDRFRWRTLAKFFKVDIAPLKIFWSQGCKPRLSFLDHDDLGRTL